MWETHHGAVYRNRGKQSRHEWRHAKWPSEKRLPGRPRPIHGRTRTGSIWERRRCQPSWGRDSSRGIRSTGTWPCRRSGERWKQLRVSAALRSSRFPCWLNWTFAAASRWWRQGNWKRASRLDRSLNRKSRQVGRLILIRCALAVTGGRTRTPNNTVTHTCTDRPGYREVHWASTRRVAGSPCCRQTGCWPSGCLLACTLPARTWRRAGWNNTEDARWRSLCRIARNWARNGHNTNNTRVSK